MPNYELKKSGFYVHLGEQNKRSLLNRRIYQAIKLYPDLLLPYLVMFSCLFIPSEIIFTHLKVDKTSIELNHFLFQTVLLGYESTLVRSVFLLTFLSQLFALIKGCFSEFLLVFMGLIYLVLACFIFYFLPESLDLGSYFCLISSGFILFFNIKQRFW